MDTQTPDTGKKQSRPQIAVWYFVGATFAFTWGSGLMPGVETRTPLSFILLGAGFIAIVAGMVVLAKEVRVAKEDAEATRPPN